MSLSNHTLAGVTIINTLQNSGLFIIGFLKTTVRDGVKNGKKNECDRKSPSGGSNDAL